MCPYNNIYIVFYKVFCAQNRKQRLLENVTECLCKWAQYASVGTQESYSL